MPDPQTIQQAVANFLSDYRKKHALTLDQIAREGRRFGATWGVQSIRHIESAKASPTMTTLLTLGLALNRLTGDELTLRDLLGEADAIAPPTALDAPFSRTWIDGALSGAPLTVGRVSVALSGGDERAREVWRDAMPKIEEIANRLSRAPADLDFESLEKLREPTLAETRAASRLHVEPLVIALWADHLWNHSLDDEARSQAGTDSTPQARGRVTRRLVEEIKTRLAERNDG